MIVEIIEDISYKNLIENQIYEVIEYLINKNIEFSVTANIEGVTFISVAQPKITNKITYINKILSNKKSSVGISFLYFLGARYWEKKVLKETKKIIQMEPGKLQVESHIEPYDLASPEQSKRCYSKQGFKTIESKTTKEINDEHYRLIDNIYANIQHFDTTAKLEITFSQDELILFPFKRLKSEILIILTP